MDIDYEELDLYNILGMSGGKDSLATALLAIERQVDPITYFFCDTGNEHEITYEYIEYLEDKLDIEIKRIFNEVTLDRWEKRREYIINNWQKDRVTPRGQSIRGLTDHELLDVLSLLKPSGNYFLDNIILNGIMPSSMKKFCSIQLKQIPIREQIVEPLLDDEYTVVSWLGIRAEESSARKSTEVVRVNDEDPCGIPLSIMYCPIVTWTHDDVFRMAKRHGVKYNPLYSKGMSRVGCFPCINANKSEIKQIAERFPETIDRIREWEKIAARVNRIHISQDRCGVISFFHKMNNGVGMSIDETVAWSKTTHGGKNYNLLDEMSQQDLTQCSAVYPVVCE